MRLLNPGTGSGTLQGCPRIWLSDDGELIVQLYVAPEDAHGQIAPCYVPAGEVLGTMPAAVLLEAAHNLEGGVM